jgi:Tfp pilus assembly protein PilF
MRLSCGQLSRHLQLIRNLVQVPVRLTLVGVILALLCAGCQTIEPSFEGNSGFPPVTPEDEYVYSNEPAVVGRKHFERGHYGLAEHYFRDAVEKDARDRDSWIGLAASYDNLKRFDLADRAYGVALKLGPPTVSLLNNLGYSYMLRGDFVKARATYRRALKLEPKNEVVRNNLRILAAQKQLPGPRS